MDWGGRGSGGGVEEWERVMAGTEEGCGEEGMDGGEERTGGRER